MRTKLTWILVALLAAALAASAALAAEKLLCVSNQQLKGEETVSSCLTKGDKFAVVDEYGFVHVLTPEEVELTKAFNPKLFQSRAYGLKYFREAPKLPPLPVSPEEG
jgi:hypothetical protein